MLLFLLFWVFIIAAICRHKKKKYENNTLGFLHPTASSGGGGERVLWVLIDQIQKRDARMHVSRKYVLYMTKRTNQEDVLSTVESQFKIRIERPIEFVYLRPFFTKWIHGEMYSRFTMFLQVILGGFFLFVEAALVNSITPTVIETVGIPMTYPLLRLLSGCRVISYTHYPIISKTMLNRVKKGIQSTTNHGIFLNNLFLRNLKYYYYVFFYWFYCFLGQFPHIIFSNSSWTRNHLCIVFGIRNIELLYPPCNVDALSSGCLPLDQREDTIVSVGQFRPEKDHLLQIRSFHKAIDALPLSAKLIMVGGARNKEDLERVAMLEKEITTRGLEDRVLLRVNCDFSEVRMHLNKAMIGLHTMVDEHFGIVILEYLAAGCLVLANRSGGVELDIIKDPSLGYLASTEKEYSDKMVEVFTLKEKNREKLVSIQKKGREYVKTFSDDAFGENFCAAAAKFL